MNMLFKKLTREEKKDFRSFVDEDSDTQQFLKKARCWHPVVRDEIIKRLR